MVTCHWNMIIKDNIIEQNENIFSYMSFCYINSWSLLFGKIISNGRTFERNRSWVVFLDF